MKSLEEQTYVVRFHLPRLSIKGRPTWDIRVAAPSAIAARELAKYEAGKAGIPVLECKVEVL